MDECIVNFSPIQPGSGDPSPDNVRPITGLNGLDINCCGENLFNKVLHSRSISDGKWYETNSWRATDLMPVKQNVIYRTLVNGQMTYTYVHYFDSDKKWMAVTTSTSRIEPTAKTKYVALCSKRNYFLKWLDTFSITEGPETVPYSEAGQKHTVDWSEEGEIYYGYVDFINGEMVGTHKKIHLDENAGWTGFANSGTRKRVYVDTGLKSLQPARIYTYSDKFMWMSYTGYPYANHCCMSLNSPGRLFLGLPLTIESLDSFKNWFAEIGGADFVYPLATPVIHKFNPTIIKTRKGINNIWSDTNGNISLKYWKH